MALASPLRSSGDTAILEAALSYARKGWAVIPLAPRSKVPMAELLPVDRRTGRRSWTPFRDRPASEAEIVSWFERVPDLNIGVLCGEASGGLVVVDVDHAPRQPLHLPPTVCASTGRGSHYYYRTDKPVETKKFPWGEVRGERSYVVAPPSVHPSGVRYEWDDFLGPDEHELAELPQDFTQVMPLVSGTCEEPRIHRYSKFLNEEAIGENRDSIFSVLDWAKSEEAAVAIMALCGVPSAVVGKSFRCPLPGHEEKHASASLWRHPESGHIYLRDWHRRSGHDWYTLPEVYRAIRTGKVCKLSQGEQIVWLIRALAEAKFIKLPVIMAPKLPEDAPSVARDVYEGFRLLLAVRSVYNPQQSAAPFSWDFAAAWTGRGRRQVGEAIKWLMSRGYMTRVAARGDEYGGGRLQAGLLAIGTPRPR